MSDYINFLLNTKHFYRCCFTLLMVMMLLAVTARRPTSDGLRKKSYYNSYKAYTYFNTTAL